MDTQTDYADARCRDYDPEMFFPLGDREDGAEVELAKAVCRACPISEECLQDHVTVPFGVYGGTTPGQRRAILLRLGQKTSRFSLNGKASR